MNAKHAFWQAFVFAIIIFLLGIGLGFFLESSRADSLQDLVTRSELNLLDQQLRVEAIDTLNVSCHEAITSTFSFADNIYAEAAQLETYDAASKLTNTLVVIHQRYDLLRMLLWTESISLKEKCSGDFHTIVYVYNYKDDDVEVKARQVYFSRLLEDLKKNHPNEVLLIPIAGNLDLGSVDIAKREYNLGNDPAIIVDESTVIDKVITYDELENIVFSDNN